jgi:hypothetical protein
LDFLIICVNLRSFFEIFLPLLELGFAGLGFDFAHAFGSELDKDSAAAVGDVATDDATVNHFGAFVNDEIALEVPEDVDAAAFFDLEVAVDAAAEIEFALLDDGDFADDHSPKGVEFGDGVVAAEFPAFFPHDG